MKSIMELMDFHNTDQYLKSPEQVAQEQQQQTQMMAQMKIMEAGLQDQMQARDDDRTLQREVVKGTYEIMFLDKILRNISTELAGTENGQQSWVKYH